jgi:hypothetical protein
MLTASEFLLKNVLEPLRTAERRLTTTNGSSDNDGSQNNKDQGGSDGDFVLHDVMWACRTAMEALEDIRDAIEEDEENSYVDPDSTHSSNSKVPSMLVSHEDTGHREKARFGAGGEAEVGSGREVGREVGRESEGRGKAAVEERSGETATISKEAFRRLIISNLSQEFPRRSSFPHG